MILIKAICRESRLGIAWYIIHLTISRKGNLQTPYIFLAFFLVLYNDYDNNYWESPFMAWHTGHLYEWLAHYVEGKEGLQRKLNKWMIDHLKTYLSQLFLAPFNLSDIVYCRQSAFCIEIVSNE